MIFKFRIISDENETFLRTVEISETDNFLNLHNIIFKACGYDGLQMTSFFVSNDDWDKLQEITLEDMKDDSTKTVPMANAIISSYVNKIEDKLIYLFDFFGDRALFCTLMEIKAEEKDTQYPICSHTTGNAPVQMLVEEDEFAELFNDMEYDEEDDFGDDDEFNEEFGEEFGEDEFNNKEY